jgi:hypothetical protein
MNLPPAGPNSFPQGLWRMSLGRIGLGSIVAMKKLILLGVLAVLSAVAVKKVRAS